MRTTAKAVVAIAQARMGSTRLPGKVLMPLAGRPVAEWVMDRASRAAVDGVVLAIPDLPEDDVLAEFAASRGYRTFRGSAADVQARYLGAVEAFHVETVVRLTCDNPFVDAMLIDRLVASHLRASAEYSSYDRSSPYPLGLAVEAFSADALRRARTMILRDYDREHVTPAFYEHPSGFRVNAVEPPPQFLRADLRMTLDTREDYEALSRLVGLVRSADPLQVGAERYVALLGEHPEIRAVNAHVRQKGLGD